MTTTYLPADDAGATLTRVGRTRGLRYGEIILVGTDAATGHRTGSVYTTMGVEARGGSRDSCPQEIWDRIDPDALAEEHHALGAMKNGPRLWCLDWAEAMTGAERDFAGLRTHWAAKLDIANAQHKPHGPAYRPVTVERDARFGVDRGSAVYLLDDPDDRTWVLKSIDLGTHPDETYDGLAGLGGRLDLPPGWTFRSTVLDSDLVLVPENGSAQVISDDRGNVYDRGGGSFSNYRP